MLDLSNPYFSAGFGLAILASAANLVGKAARSGANLAYKRMIVNLEIRSSDDAYYWVLAYLKSPKLLEKPATSRLSKWTSRFSPPPPDKLAVRTTTQRVSTRFSLLPGMGKYVLPYRGTWISVERSRDAANVSTGVPWETLSLTTLSLDRQLFPLLVQEARDEAMRNLEGKMLIYTSVYGYTSYGHEWRPFGPPRRKRALSSVILDTNISSNLLADVSQFLSSETWYTSRGIPWRRGYLLHGPPGSGKTSYIQALAGHLNYDISILSLGDRGMTDDRLAHLLVNLPTRSILLLEDIDAAFQDRSEDDPRYVGVPGLTLSGLLNALDGVASCEERVVFMTTNYPERLDAALVRPGRVDLKVHISDASDVQVIDMFNRFYNTDQEDGRVFLDRLRKSRSGRVSCAQLQGYFVLWKGDADGAIANVADLTAKQTSKHTVKFMPFNIAYSGPAKVDMFFIEDKDTGTASFRGKRLVPNNIAIPDGYHGVVAVEQSVPKQDTFWRTESCFQEIVSFSSDSSRANNHIQQGINYLQLADIVHGYS